MTRTYFISIKDAFDVPQKRYQHDCDKCKFVGSLELSSKLNDVWSTTYEDIYICPYEDAGSIIRRRSNEGSNYGSFDLNSVGIGVLNPKEGTYEWIINKLIEDGILKLKFQWDFNEKGYRCAHCDRRLTPKSHGAFEQYPWCDNNCKEATEHRIKQLLNDNEEEV